MARTISIFKVPILYFVIFKIAGQLCEFLQQFDKQIETKRRSDREEIPQTTQMARI